MPIIVKAILFTFLISAVYCDIRTWKVPNALCVAGMGTGVIVAGITGGLEGIGYSLLGIVIPILILFVLFALKLMGAGDIKLLAVAGSFAGTQIFSIIIYSFLAGGVISVIYLLSRFIIKVFKNFRSRRSRSVCDLKVFHSPEGKDHSCEEKKHLHEGKDYSCEEKKHLHEGKDYSCVEKVYTYDESHYSNEAKQADTDQKKRHIIHFTLAILLGVIGYYVKEGFL